MSAGLMRERITIQAAEQTPDGYGEVAPVYTTVATVWARKLEQRARQFLQAEQVAEQFNIVFRIWYREDITAKHRILWRGRTFDIVSVVNPDDDRRELDLRCVEHG